MSYGRIHLQYHLSRGGDGAEVIYALRNNDTLSKKIANEFENAGQNVRKYYQKRLPSDASKDYYYLHRNTPNNETVIVEYGFTDSKGDDVSKIKNNWQGLTEAVVKSLASYIGVPYKAKTTNNNDYYIVQKGDTLYGIANKFGTTVDTIKRNNNLTSNTLQIGQKLIINKSKEDNNTYFVAPGDTLYSIARKYNITVDNLKKANNLTTNMISINQKLIIPSSNIKYYVKKGDTLYAIANKYNTTVDKIKKDNNLTSNTLQIGQKLLIQ